MEYKLDLDSYLEDLEKLVNIDSGSRDRDGIVKVAEFFQKKYDDLGLKTTMHNVGEDVGPCLEIRNSDSEEIDVLLLGHMDTVFPKGTAEERPYSREGNKAYGPGVIDMKSGLLSIYHVMKQIVDSGIEAPNICILQNGDEEISSIGSRPKIEELAKKSRYAFVLEPARKTGHLVYERKGLAKYRVEFKGVAAHPGVDPENGRSAINELGHWITEIHSLIDLSIGTMLNVGIVGGGLQANVIAEDAWAEIDLRYVEMSEIDRVEAKIKELVENPRTDGVTTKVRKIGQRPPMNPSKESMELLRTVEAIGRDLGVKIEGTKTGGGSDANFTAALGVPTIDGLGPIGGNSHGVDEYLEIDSIEPRLNVLRELILKVGF